MFCIYGKNVYRTVVPAIPGLRGFEENHWTPVANLPEEVADVDGYQSLDDDKVLRTGVLARNGRRYIYDPDSNNWTVFMPYSVGYGRKDEAERRAIERAEDWRAIWHELEFSVPALRFKPHWDVVVVPPRGGAVGRFLVRTERARVSVYLDWYGRLGCEQRPYWEAYSGDDENGPVRFALQDTSELMAWVAQEVDLPGYTMNRSTLVSSTTEPNGFSFVINVPAGGAQ